MAAPAKKFLRIIGNNLSRRTLTRELIVSFKIQFIAAGSR
jgi:hypothetical protein